MLGVFFGHVRAWGDEFARDVERVLDEAVDHARVRLSDLFDAEYVELKGDGVRTLARLFDVGPVGRDGFAPPKYRTIYDHLVDESLAPVCDRHAARDSKLVFASVTDLNGFALMVPATLRRDITGDRLRDLEGNRIKRIFEDTVGLLAARVGLDHAGEAPRRASRTVLLERGIDLGRPPGPRPFMLQTYARDTGQIFNDVAFPVYVKGERFGSVRLAYEPAAA
ncbi:MAG: methyl-accepting chemotaxis protein [Candidatus Eremiobacteraeota bacterium]|nr:methyl-accepting chemotaxis protein [Candidatus Eremiobacteraeota bacterium]